MKNKIRLTESQLHAIIKESVNKILNEMYPETFYSAANKRARQGNKAAGNKLFNYALDRVAKDNNVKGADAFNFSRQYNQNADRYEVTSGESPMYNSDDAKTDEYLDNWDKAFKQASDMPHKKWDGKQWK